MLSYIILIPLQFIAAFLGAPQILAHIPVTGDPRMFVHAGLYAVIVWIIGVLGSLVLKDVRQPGSSSLALAMLFALAGAAALVTGVYTAIPLHFPPLYLPLAGALLGYLIRR